MGNGSNNAPATQVSTAGMIKQMISQDSVK